MAFPIPFHLEGARNWCGTRFIKVEISGSVGYIPHLLLAGDERDAKRMLAAQGVMIGPYWRELQREAIYIKDFELVAIADRIGWNGDFFVMPSGRLVTPKDAPAPHIVFETDSSQSARAGTLADWLERVALPLTGQSLPMTVFLAVFAGPLVELVGRRENVGIALLGEPGSGKSTILDLAMSIMGRPRAGSFNTTVDGLETAIVSHNGLSLILDELNLFYGDEAPNRRGAKQKLATFKLADGRIKTRWSIKGGEQFHYTWLTATNEQIQYLMASEVKGVVRATSDRMLTLKISGEREHQTFDTVPDHYGSVRDFARDLQQGAAEHHGHAMLAYVQGLVTDLHEDRKETIARIQTNVDSWCDRVGIDENNGSEGRVGEAFGLFYAAGEEAKRHGVLPDEWRCGSAVERVYRELYVGPKAPIPIDDVMRTYLSQDNVYDMDARGLRRMADTLLARTPAILKTNRNGQLEAIIPPAAAAANLPGLSDRLASSEAGLKLNGEVGRNDNKREVRRGHGLERMIVLTLPKGFLKAA